MEEGCLLAIALAGSAQAHLPRKSTTHKGWTFLHQLAIKKNAAQASAVERIP